MRRSLRLCRSHEWRCCGRVRGSSCARHGHTVRLCGRSSKWRHGRGCVRRSRRVRHGRTMGLCGRCSEWRHGRGRVQPLDGTLCKAAGAVWCRDAIRAVRARPRVSRDSWAWGHASRRRLRNHCRLQRTGRSGWAKARDWPSDRSWAVHRPWSIHGAQEGRPGRARRRWGRWVLLLREGRCQGRDLVARRSCRVRAGDSRVVIPGVRLPGPVVARVPPCAEVVRHGCVIWRGVLEDLSGCGGALGRMRERRRRALHRSQVVGDGDVQRHAQKGLAGGTALRVGNELERAQRTPIQNTTCLG